MDEGLIKKMKKMGVRFPVKGERWENNHTKHLVTIEGLDGDVVEYYNPSYGRYQIDQFIMDFSPLEEANTPKQLKKIQKVIDKMEEL